jgi:two-component system response regulator BaeR
MSRILLVEEGRDAASVLHDELHQAGHEIEHIEDGALALHRMLTAPPALTLLDVALPHVSGLHILEKVRARSDHPVIMLTARGRGYAAMLDGHALPLTRRESLLLRALSQEPGRVLTRSKLLEVAFPEALDVNERVVDTHIKNLRKKLATVSAAHDWIRSVYGVGFAWESRARHDA